MNDKVEQRNAKILSAAFALAAERGYRSYSRDDVARAAGVSAGSVNNAYGTMDGLHDAVMARAVAERHHAIVGQGLALRHPAALAAPQDLKDSALASLAA